MTWYYRRQINFLFPRQFCGLISFLFYFIFYVPLCINRNTLEEHCNDFVSGTTWCLILLSNNKKNNKKSVSSSLTSHLFSSPEMKNTPHVTERQMVLEKRWTLHRTTTITRTNVLHTRWRARAHEKTKSPPPQKKKRKKNFDFSLTRINKWKLHLFLFF